MKISLFATLLLFCVSSCSTKIYPVQNSYAELPYTTRSGKNVDQVWDKLVDMFAQNGLSIKLIDKSSGLIVSDNSAISVTWENKNGDLMHPDAYVVVPKYKDSYLQEFVPLVGGHYLKKSDLKKPGIIRGEWNVRIKKDDQGSIINVNLVNVTYTAYDRTRKVQLTKNLSDFKSTGNFERSIAELIK